jgi:hypothetical protein
MNALDALGQNICPEYKASKLAHHIGLDAVMFLLDNPTKSCIFYPSIGRSA